MKETAKIPIPPYREQDSTREHCDEIKGKIKNRRKIYLLTISDSFVMWCQ